MVNNQISIGFVKIFSLDRFIKSLTIFGNGNKQIMEIINSLKVTSLLNCYVVLGQYGSRSTEGNRSSEGSDLQVEI